LDCFTLMSEAVLGFCTEADAALTDLLCLLSQTKRLLKLSTGSSARENMLEPSVVNPRSVRSSSDGSSLPNPLSSLNCISSSFASCSTCLVTLLAWAKSANSLLVAVSLND